MLKSKIFLPAFLILFVASASAQRDYCFRNDGLKVQQTASFTLTGSKLSGTFVTGGYDDSTPSETSEFTGTKRGNLLAIKFTGKVPYNVTPGTRSISWTLKSKSLIIPMYGKNYNTGKYSAYTATFERCKEI